MILPEIKISSLHHLIQEIDEIKRKEEEKGNSADFLFRGQQQDWDLLPKLSRLRLKGQIIKIEKIILEEFRRTSLPLSDITPKDDWDLVALAQHHGLPTRLLDWSYSTAKPF